MKKKVIVGDDMQLITFLYLIIAPFLLMQIRGYKDTEKDQELGLIKGCFILFTIVFVLILLYNIFVVRG